MNWFDIIKNQIASTKGKQFQLDFSQPMVEEEDDCKKRLSVFFELLGDFSRLESMGFWCEITRYEDFIESISEDIACKIIDEMLNLERTILKGKKRTDPLSLVSMGDEFLHGPYIYNYRGLKAFHNFTYNTEEFIEGQDNLFIKYEYENEGIKTRMSLDLFGIGYDQPLTDVFKFIKENL